MVTKTVVWLTGCRFLAEPRPSLPLGDCQWEESLNGRLWMGLYKQDGTFLLKHSVEIGLDMRLEHSVEIGLDMRLEHSVEIGLAMRLEHSVEIGLDMR